MEEKYSRVEYNSHLYKKQFLSEFTIQVIIYILTGLCFLVSLFAILITPAKAVASNYSADVTSNLAYVPGYCNYNNFCVRYQSSQSWASLQVNENFTAPTDKFAFLVNHSVYYNAPSTISLWVDNASFQNSGITCTIRDDNNQFITCTIEKVNDNRINLNFTTPASVSGRLSFFVNTTNGYLTFMPTAKVTKAVLFQTIPSGNQNDYSDILNNQNQNTSDIISNNNSNTENIMNNNNDNTQNVISNVNTNFLKLLGELATICPNLFDNSNVVPNYNINADGTYSYNTSSSLTVVVVEPGQSYTLKSDVNRQWVYNFSNTFNFGDSVGTARVVTGSNMISFVVPEGYNRFILRSFPTNNENNATQNVMMLKGRNLPASAFGSYCVHGTLTRNKLDDISAGIGGVVSGLGDVEGSVDDVKDSVDDVKDTLTDDNVDNDVGADFFDDWDDLNPGGISGIITAPLSIINSLLSNYNSCDDLSLPSFMGVSNATLPSGCIFWNKVSNDLPIGVTLWNILICGSCSYILLIDLFKLLQKLRDPMSNVVEVMKL